jgi:hypothetical protein
MQPYKNNQKFPMQIKMKRFMGTRSKVFCALALAISAFSGAAFAASTVFIIRLPGIAWAGDIASSTSSTSSSSQPSTPGAAAAIFSGPDSDTALVLLPDGTLLGTGYNADGELGLGTSANKNSLTSIATNVATAGAFAGHTSIVKNDGSMWVTGINPEGQLGDKTTTSRFTFEEIFTTGVAQVAGDAPK